MPEALIGFILAWGFLTMVLSFLRPIHLTKYAKEIIGMAWMPVIMSLIWLLVELLKCF
ncbi:hypothetical protein LCGC14_1708990 [marine sediment metagenome]|uniref:Uncharacterized protein n=1 Tax=marine sediment metagenome TaxID=412755 RepID=A0A0F9HGB0_9ZZZZ